MDNLQTFQQALQSDFVTFAREVMEKHTASVLLYHAGNDSINGTLNGHLTQINFPEDMGVAAKTTAADAVTNELNARLAGIIDKLIADTEKDEKEQPVAANRFLMGLAITPANITVNGVFDGENFSFNMNLTPAP